MAYLKELSPIKQMLEITRKQTLQKITLFDLLESDSFLLQFEQIKSAGELINNLLEERFFEIDRDIYKKHHQVEALKHRLTKMSVELDDAFSQRVNLLAQEFIESFCKPDFSINWDKIFNLVENHSKKQPLD